MILDLHAHSKALDGGSRRGENEPVQALVDQYRYSGVGGSDAHLVSLVGLCATAFDDAVRTAEDLVVAPATFALSLQADGGLPLHLLVRVATPPSMRASAISCWKTATASDSSPKARR